MITNEELLQRIEDLEAQMQQVRDGSIVEHISSAWHWKSTTKELAGGTDYTADGAWTDLSLNKWTSGKAKYVILRLSHANTCTAADEIAVRENGKTPTSMPDLISEVSGKGSRQVVFCKMDSSQVIEYFATDASDTTIDVLGYIE